MPPDIGMRDKKTCLSSLNKPRLESISSGRRWPRHTFKTEVGRALVKALYMQASSINLTDLLFDSCNESPKEIYAASDRKAVALANKKLFELETERKNMFISNGRKGLRSIFHQLYFSKRQNTILVSLRNLFVLWIKNS